MQPHSIASGADGGPGGIAFSDSAPGGFRFLSPCRKEQRDTIEQHENVLISRPRGTVTRWLPQSLRDSYPQPHSARPPLTGCRLFRLTRSSRFRLRRTAHWADTRIAPLLEGGSVHNHTRPNDRRSRGGALLL